METSAAPDTVELRLDLTARDYARLSRWHFLHSTWGRILLAVTTAFVLYAIVATLASDDPGKDAGGAIVAAAFLLAYWLMCLPLQWRLSAARTYATQRAAHEQHAFVAAEGGLSSASPLGSDQQRWEVFWRAAESKEAFYLHLSRAMALVLPKRCFTSEEQMQRFRDLLRAGMGARARGLRAAPRR